MVFQLSPKHYLAAVPQTASTYAAITGYSKVSRGLHDPLEIFGLHTEQSVRKVLDRDSGQLVTPFMHVVNQTTRYFATLREL